MELSEMKNLWIDHGKQLEKSLKINEMLLNRLNLDKAAGQFRELLGVSVHGRNMAFVYFLTSAGLALFLENEPVFSVPLLFGGLCMLGSFIYHLKNTGRFTHLNIYETPVFELQKAINEFKISSISAGKYDFGVVVIWLATLMPAILKLTADQDLYRSPLHAGLYSLLVLIAILVLYPVNLRIYRRMYGEKLSNAEDMLNEIREFKQ